MALADAKSPPWIAASAFCSSALSLVAGSSSSAGSGLAGSGLVALEPPQATAVRHTNPMLTLCQRITPLPLRTVALGAPLTLPPGSCLPSSCFGVLFYHRQHGMDARFHPLHLLRLELRAIPVGDVEHVCDALALGV